MNSKHTKTTENDFVKKKFRRIYMQNKKDIRTDFPQFWTLPFKKKKQQKLRKPRT